MHAFAGRSPGAACAERQVLTAMLHSETACKWLTAQVSPHDFGDEVHRRVFELVQEEVGQKRGAADVQALLARELEPQVCALLSELALEYDAAALPDTELRQAAERLCEWRDARRCKELLAKSGTQGLTAEECAELTQLKRHRSQTTGRRTLGELAS
jgi:replicative DNA helicase